VDGFGNVASAAYSVSVDDSPPAITQPNADVDKNWHSGLPGSTTSQITVIASIDDQGSGVFAAPALALPDGGVVSTAHLLAGGDAQHGRWQYDAFSAPADSALDGQITLTATAVDGVGNVGASGQAIKVNVDNVPPSFNGFSHTPDGNGFYRGPSVAFANDPAALDIKLAIIESHLASVVATLPGSGQVQGLLQIDGKVHFAIPRSIGLGGGKKTVSFKATDLANNSAQSSLDLWFDDVPPSFTTASDDTWYSQQNGAIPTSLTLSAMPLSGIASVTLNAGSAPSCQSSGVSSDGLTYRFTFAGSCADAGKEDWWPLSMTVTNGVGVEGTSPTKRRIDGAPPAVQVEAILYPAAAPPPLDYSHDGSHFNLREGNVGLVTFMTWDCGGGLSASLPASYSIGGNPGTRSVSCQPSGAFATCKSGMTPAMMRCTVAADLASTAPWSYAGLENAVGVGLAVGDTFGHPNSASTNINVTRRLWKSGPNGLQRAAAGPPPHVFVGGTSGMFAFDRVNGNGTQWTSTAVGLGPAVSPNGGDPLVYWVDGTQGPLRAASATFAFSDRSRCGFSSGSGVTYGAFSGLPILNDGRVAASISWSRDVTTCVTTCGCSDECTDRCCRVCTTDCQTSTQEGTNSVALRAGGCEASPLSTAEGNVVLGRGWYYWAAGGLTASWLSGSSSRSVASSASHTVVFEWSDGDAVAGDDGTRRDFNGSSWIAPVSLPLLSWPFSVTSFGSLIVGNMGGNWGVQRVDGLGMGTALAPASTSVAPIIDSSTSPTLVYLGSPTGGGSEWLLAAPLTTSGGFDPIQFAVPFGAPINDLVLASDGSLLVVSGGAVAVIVTDSRGLGTGSGGANAWPAPGRDACKSFNLDFACPY
jgi:hypothetical protein